MDLFLQILAVIAALVLGVAVCIGAAHGWCYLLFADYRAKFDGAFSRWLRSNIGE